MSRTTRTGYWWEGDLQEGGAKGLEQSWTKEHGKTPPNTSCKGGQMGGIKGGAQVDWGENITWKEKENAPISMAIFQKVLISANFFGGGARFPSFFMKKKKTKCLK